MAALVAGVVAVAVVVRLKERSAKDESVHHQLRDVQDVLTDCYKKISEIEQHLPELIDTDRSTVVHRFSNQTS